MASFEDGSGLGLPPEQPSLEFLHIPVPAEPDEKWCEMLESAYGDGSYRTTITTESYKRQILPYHGGSKRYKSNFCETDDGTPGRIDGLFVGAKMIPEFDNGPYAAHLVLIDAEQELAPFWIAGHPTQEFLIPLNHSHDELFFYPDALR